jgi:hemolysin III
MTEHHDTCKRPQSRGEEIANCASHAVAVVAALAAVPVLIMAAMERGDAAAVVGASVFAGAMVLLYAVSAVYHALPQNRAKCVFRILDHMAIYLLIAGSYTPFTLGVLRGAWGWTLLSLVWGLAVIGILLKACAGVRFEVFSVLLYLAMGWLCLIAVEPLLRLMPMWGIVWLLAGGIAYTLGVVFYALDNRVRYSHFVWHLFVVAGTACHFVAVLQYAA